MPKILVAIVICMSMSGCGDVYRYLKSGPVGWAINKETRYKKQTEIDLSKITGFDWDQLVIFGAYSRQIEICNRLQLDDRSCTAKISDEPDNEGEMLMVFLQHGEVVHSEIHIGWHGAFSVDDTTTLTPQNAIFVVERRGTLYSGEANLILRLKHLDRSAVPSLQ